MSQAQVVSLLERQKTRKGRRGWKEEEEKKKRGRKLVRFETER